MSRLLTNLTITMAAVAAGCGVEHKIHSASGAASTRSVVPKVATPVDQAFLIERDSAGPIRLGMPREKAAKLGGFTVSPATLRLEGKAAPVLRFEHSGEVLAVAEMTSDRLSRIRVLNPRFATSEGVRVGTTARELEKQYGPGKVFTGKGTVCAAFRKAPGRVFCFRSVPDLLVKPDWKKVAARNPVVEVIQVVLVK